MDPVLKICFGPPTAESKNLKNHVNFDVGDLFFRSPALWSSQNVFGPPTAGRVVVDIKDRDVRGVQGLVCAQLINLVCRGKGDGPREFLLNVVSKDGGNLARGFFVNWKWKIHIHSFEWEQRLLKRINGKALLRASFQLRINDMARGTYYWII